MSVLWSPQEWAWQAVLLVTGLASLSRGSDGNMLDTMLLKNGRKGGSERKSEESSGTATVSAQNLLLCHCNHHCPESSVNNTCMTDGYCFTMVEEEEGGVAVLTAGCLGLAGSEFQCRDTGKARSRRALECCTDQDYCNRDLHPTLPPLMTSGETHTHTHTHTDRHTHLFTRWNPPPLKSASGFLHQALIQAVLGDDG
uniref:Activin types I and II receptor domain-containing protein n=1 Tax=Scophthalmus maximus TaxID=52904 RepID=A0A8D3D8B8_SCOMX